MRVAIFMRGPFRPNLDSSLERARALVDEVKANGDQPALFFATWLLEDRTYAEALMRQPDVDHALFIEPPSDQTIYALCGMERLPLGNPTKNMFYQYYLSKIGLQVVDSLGLFDFVIHSRPDMDIRLGKYYHHWFEAGRYTTIHDIPPDGEGIVNDQFGVATPIDMRAAWNCGTLEELGAMIGSSEVAEDPLRMMLEKAGLKSRCAPTEKWALDPRRYG
ncbi:hypothetical protein [Methylosinus sp. sav-2]|jgi:hypothetical protein|uniref:hypothetical protein n=1 Tax=Methylosinus sp. sav-2 TaxID=2485168 RepID=UPI0010663FD4|nr:hypothetical protein [Methylosinus sp. sav-2]